MSAEYHVKSNLENINTLSGDVTIKFILFSEMSSEHLCRLINCMLNLHSNTTTGLIFLDNLGVVVLETAPIPDGRLTSNDLWLISKDVLITDL